MLITDKVKICEQIKVAVVCFLKESQWERGAFHSRITLFPLFKSTHLESQYIFTAEICCCSVTAPLFCI